jgi:alpha-glucosidase
VEAYESLPEDVRDFLRDIPVVWDETQYLAGEPGNFVVLARRSGDDWYVAGINGQDEAREVTLDLSFLMIYYLVRIIGDGADRLSFSTNALDFFTDASFDVTMQPYGGFVMHLTPAQGAD